MEKFKRSGKFKRFIIMQTGAILAYLGYNMVGVKKIMDVASLSEKTHSCVTDPAEFDNKTFYSKEIIKSAILLKKFSNVLAEKIM
jgi:hypothetical protein